MGELPSGMLILVVPCWCWRLGWTTDCPRASAAANSLEHSECCGGTVLVPWTGRPLLRVVRTRAGWPWTCGSGCGLAARGKSLGHRWITGYGKRARCCPGPKGLRRGPRKAPRPSGKRCQELHWPMQLWMLRSGPSERLDAAPNGLQRSPRVLRGRQERGAESCIGRCNFGGRLRSRGWWLRP